MLSWKVDHVALMGSAAVPPLFTLSCLTYGILLLIDTVVMHQGEENLQQFPADHDQGAGAGFPAIQRRLIGIVHHPAGFHHVEQGAV